MRDGTAATASPAGRHPFGVWRSPTVAIDDGATPAATSRDGPVRDRVPHREVPVNRAHVRVRVAAALAATAVATSVAAVVGAPGAAAAADPVVRVSTPFTVGAQIGASDLTDDAPENDVTRGIPMTVRWSAGPDAVCGYDLDRLYAGSPPTRLLADRRARRYADAAMSDDQGAFGGGSRQATGWRVAARPCGGGAAVSTTAGRSVLVTQESGESGSEAQMFAELPRLAATGDWTTSTCRCASGGQQRYSTEAGASVAITKAFRRGEHIGLVMATGPARGEVDVLLDGRRVATVDTAATSKRNRVVVLDRWMPAGTHTVTVVNAGTPGRSRVDLDAVLTG